MQIPPLRRLLTGRLVLLFLPRQLKQERTLLTHRPQVKMVFAKPRPKVRARDRVGPSTPIAEQDAVIRAPLEVSTTEPHTNLNPPGDHQNIAGEDRRHCCFRGIGWGQIRLPRG